MPIHTDRGLLEELRSREKRKTGIMLAISFLCLVLFCIITKYHTFKGLAEVVILTAGMLSAGVLGMSLVLNWGCYFRKDY